MWICKLVPTTGPLHFYSPLPRMFSPLSFTWLVSSTAWMLPSQEWHIYHCTLSHCFVLSCTELFSLSEKNIFIGHMFYLLVWTFKRNKPVFWNLGEYLYVWDSCIQDLTIGQEDTASDLPGYRFLGLFCLNWPLRLGIWEVCFLLHDGGYYDNNQ